MGKILCVICGEINPENFYPKRHNKCKKCLSDAYQKRPDKKDYIEKQKLAFSEWVLKNLIQYRLTSAKHRALRKGLTFELDYEIILNKLKEQNYKCYVSKKTLSLTEKGWYTISIDRLDSTLGYTIDNTVLVTKFVNSSKNNLSLDEYMKLLREVCDAQ
jgi:hypothetical protein